MSPESFAAAVAGRLIVSCQAPAGHPLRDTAALVRMARAAAEGGAAAIRCGGVGGAADVAAVAAAVDVPVIGLTKDGADGVFITPTAAAARSVAAAGAAVVAADATSRPRPDGRPLGESVEAVHEAGALFMADVSTLAEGVAAAEAGADAVATTLAGYTVPGPPPEDPDLGLVRALRRALPGALIVAEGRYHSPAAAAAAIEAGATCVVVGAAITDPRWITARFAAAVHGRERALGRSGGPLR
ncbi:putative N-acetylmannosamine-6-phosphate 2-epimerase [Actinomadura chibensis]|uniref:N-acylglucosamine-6-phosphate 2-epimerase n=1 Tax=Actinomadura chibensis TaxID=392828 RepID=A0A5D0NBW9_9ACTN|nr:putative N-acetylmannosamine-6-phosphate 2-epimerase [Actinomadura chibensis]TYB41873.1 putative N-acetylmannosamine-6-phosphate 2-epimerase [Actinomadura chibensis]